MHLEGCGKPLDLFVQRKRVYQQIWFLASELCRHPGGTYSFFSFMLNVAGNMIDDQVSASQKCKAPVLTSVATASGDASGELFCGE